MSTQLRRKTPVVLMLSATFAFATGCSVDPTESPNHNRAKVTSQLLGSDQSQAQASSGATITQSEASAASDSSTTNVKGQDKGYDGDAKDAKDPKTPATPAPVPEDDTKDNQDKPNQSPTGKGGSGPDVDDDGLCRWFDPNEVNYAAEIPGAPSGLLIPINRYRSNGRFESGNFMFEFLVYHNGTDTNIGSQTSLDTFRNAKKATFLAIIMKANSSSCYALASVKKATARNHNGCFAMSTKIRMADGKDLPIALLKKGDRVLNPVTGRAVPIIRVIEGPELKPMFEVGTKTSKVTVTEKHPFLTSSGLKAAKDLQKTDLVLDADGKFYPLKTLNQLPIDPNQLVRNITLGDLSRDPRAHMVMADGVVTGDLYLQSILETSIMSTVSNSK